MKESNIGYSYFPFKSQNAPGGAEKEKKIYAHPRNDKGASLSSFMRIDKKRRRKRRKII